MRPWNDGWNPTPPSDWRVRDPRGVLDTWLSRRPPQTAVEAVRFWLLAVEVAGPPADATRLSPGDDMYSSTIAETGVTVTYRVNEYEYLVALQSIV